MAVSDENISLVRWAYEEGHAKRTVEMPQASERISSEYVFYARRGFPGRETYRLEEMPMLWADLDETFSANAGTEET